MIVGGQTEARAQLSSTIIDYHEPFDQGFKLEIQKTYFPLNEATRANLQVNKRILKWRPFWNKVYNNKNPDSGL